MRNVLNVESKTLNVKVLFGKPLYFFANDARKVVIPVHCQKILLNILPQINYSTRCKFDSCNINNAWQDVKTKTSINAYMYFTYFKNNTKVIPFLLQSFLPNYSIFDSPNCTIQNLMTGKHLKTSI